MFSWRLTCDIYDLFDSFDWLIRTQACCRSGWILPQPTVQRINMMEHKRVVAVTETVQFARLQLYSAKPLSTSSVKSGGHHWSLT